MHFTSRSGLRPVQELTVGPWEALSQRAAGSSFAYRRREWAERESGKPGEPQFALQRAAGGGRAVPAAAALRSVRWGPLGAAPHRPAPAPQLPVRGSALLCCPRACASRSCCPARLGGGSADDVTVYKQHRSGQPSCFLPSDVGQELLTRSKILCALCCTPERAQDIKDPALNLGSRELPLCQIPLHYIPLLAMGQPGPTELLSTALGAGWLCPTARNDCMQGGGKRISLTKPPHFAWLI